MPRLGTIPTALVELPRRTEYCESVDVASPKRTKCFQLFSMGPIPLLQHKLTKCITDPQLKLFFREQASLSDSRYTRILPSTTQTLSYSFLEGASLGFGSQPNTWLMFVLYRLGLPQHLLRIKPGMVCPFFAIYAEKVRLIAFGDHAFHL